jgi:alpha-ketoglutarate-dependent taurine dioxygenase
VNLKRCTEAVLDIDGENGRASQWHTDVTFVEAFPLFSVLRGVVIPPVGGDTVWANTVAAYETLPPVLRGLADQLWALHANAYDYAATLPTPRPGRCNATRPCSNPRSDHLWPKAAELGDATGRQQSGVHRTCRNVAATAALDPQQTCAAVLGCRQ